MTDADPVRTRRGVLALAGASLAALSGCNGIGNPLASESESPAVSGSALADVLGGEVPTVTEPLPIEVESAAFEERRARVRELLSSVPSPLSAEAVPNGAIREELSEAREEARSDLDEAANGPGALDRLDALRDARASARKVAAGWAAIEGDLSRADLEADRDVLGDEVRAFRERWRYVGGPSDPVAALLAHAAVEDRVERSVDAVRGLRRSGREPGGSPVDVGELAADVERARASLADARYLYDRWTASLDSGVSVGPAFTSADEALTAALDERVAELPSADADALGPDEEHAPIGEALTGLDRFERRHSVERHRETGQRANVALSLADELQRVRAFESLRDRVENGEYVVVTSADDVRTLRRRAVEAIEAVAGGEGAPPVVRQLCSGLPGSVQYADRELRRYADEESVNAGSVAREAEYYVSAAALASAAPRVAVTVDSALASGSD